MKDYLDVPEGYFKAVSEGFSPNGLGPQGYGVLVPDSAYGLSLTSAGNIHDYDFSEVSKNDKTSGDLNKANTRFKKNMYAIIDHETSWGWLKWVRKKRANTIYMAVDKFGHKFYHGS